MTWLGLGICSVILGACGGGSDKQSATKAITVPAPTTPTAAQCGQGSGSPSSDAERPPKPGTYAYTLKGQKTLISDQNRVFQLPAESTVIITPAQQSGDITCFTLQRRFDSDLADTGVFAIRGQDIYLRSVRFQSGGYIKSFTPNPTILSLSGSELSWSGEFRGTTSGRYAAEIIGRKQMKIGSQTVRTVGVQNRGSFGGDIKGWERSTRWFAVGRNIIVAEKSTQQRDFGLDKLRLTYSAQLKSLDPT